MEFLLEVITLLGVWFNVYIQYTWPGRKEGLEEKHKEK